MGLISIKVGDVYWVRDQYLKCAEQINDLIKKIDNLVINELPQGWEGDSYNAFRDQHVNEIRPVFRNMEGALVTIAKQLNVAVAHATAADQASRVDLPTDIR